MTKDDWRAIQAITLDRPRDSATGRIEECGLRVHWTVGMIGDRGAMGFHAHQCGDGKAMPGMTNHEWVPIHQGRVAEDVTPDAPQSP